MNNNNNLTPVTTPETTTPETTTPVTTTPETRCRDWGSMQKGVDTSGIHFKSILELRREFGENWV